MDVLTPEQRRRNMAAIRGRDTKPEMIVRRLVKGLGFRFSKYAKRLPGRPDLVFSKRRKVIFVHGCFWHLHKCKYGMVVPATRRDFWQQKRQGNAQRDRKNRAALRKLGWGISVIWECQTKNPERLGRRISRFLNTPTRIQKHE
jgi:DNA mismatch endonuclease, patch repair protein